MLVVRNSARNIAASEFLAVGEKNVTDGEKNSDISSEISFNISLLFSLETRRPAIISLRFIAGYIPGNIARV